MASLAEIILLKSSDGFVSGDDPFASAKPILVLPMEITALTKLDQAYFIDEVRPGFVGKDDYCIRSAGF